MKTSELPKVDYRSVKPLQGNLKDLTEDNFEKLKRVLEKRGFDVPLFMWNGFILDGHQRVRVAQKIDLKPYEVPYIEIDAKDENEAKKRVLEISSQYGTITQEGYDEFTADLPEAELIETVNFDALKWDNEPQVEEDEAPEVSKEPAKSELGKVYQLGRHRLMCGDATKDVETLMAGAKADMVFTDPPYGIDHTGVSIGGISKVKNSQGKKILGDLDTSVAKSAFEIWKDYPVIVVFGGNYFTDFLPVNGHWIVWNKMAFDKPGQHFSDCELAWTNVDKTAVKMYQQIWDGAFRQGPKSEELSSRVHQHQKPVGLSVKIIRDYGQGDVLDPFGGSGSTLIACEQLDRTCYMMELDPKYCDVIRKRYWKLVNDDNEDGWEDNTPVISEGTTKDAEPAKS